MEKTTKIIGSTYEILEEIGSGGGGIVYLGNHIRLGKKVVLKADKRKITTHQELLKKEVNVLKELSNDYIPQVYDFFEEDGVVYTVIDYVPGESLDKPLKRGEKFSQAQIITWAKQVLNALVYLHDPSKHGDPPKGYIHSDIKPANIMRRPDNSICLIDFNIALALGEPNIRAYSPGYSSPEHYGLDYSTYGTHAVGQIDTVQTEGVEIIKQNAIEDNKNTVAEITEQQNTGTVLDADEMYQEADAKKTVMDSEDIQICQVHSPGQTVLGSQTETVMADDGTIAETGALVKDKEEKSEVASKKQSGQKSIYPDVRSDIYMLGATLYHLVSGVKPARNALEVIPLSDNQFSDCKLSKAVVEIITKAMNPNPDLRYQTAAEMLQDFLDIRKNDPRTVRQKRQRKVVIPFFILLMVISACSMLVGLKRMQILEEWKSITEYAENALQAGDVSGAKQLVLQAFPEQKWPFEQPYLAKSQYVLTEASGVYQLADQYSYDGFIELPSEPTAVKLSPNGKVLACIASETLLLYNLEDRSLIAELPACESALSEMDFVDNERVIYAGRDGISLYDLTSKNNLWTGSKGTAIDISRDKKRVVTIYRDEAFATVYSIEDGSLITVIDFEGHKQDVVPNDIFLNPDNNLLAINDNGSMIAVSFADGGLKIFDIRNSDGDIEIFDASSGYTHFEGGFDNKLFAFSASNINESIFAIVDVEKEEQVGAFPASPAAYGVKTSVVGITVQQDNYLVRLNPETGEQIPLITTKEVFNGYTSNDNYSVISTQDGLLIYDKDAKLIETFEVQEQPDYLCAEADTIVCGSMSSAVLKILKRESKSAKSILEYDSDYLHAEARISSDDKTVMLFNYDRFRIYDLSNGAVLADVNLENETGKESIQVYDQQYLRQNGNDVLQITYNDGTLIIFDAGTGKITERTYTDTVRDDLLEIFNTENYVIESPLHGAPRVYDKDTHKFITEISKDDYLSYVYEVNGVIILQFIAADKYVYGAIVNQEFEPIANLPYLCDVMNNNLYFDCPTGNIRVEHIFSLKELLEKVKEK